MPQDSHPHPESVGKQSPGKHHGEPSTRERVLTEALESFAADGYTGTSLDDLATKLGIRKQTILYYFPSKEALLHAVIDTTVLELAGAFAQGIARPARGWERVEAVVRAVFRLAARRPAVLSIVREVSSLGPPHAHRLSAALEPHITAATIFLQADMDAGRLRRHDPRLVLLLAYSAVLVATTEVEALRAVGVEPTPRSLLKRRRDLLGFFRAALVMD